MTVPTLKDYKESLHFYLSKPYLIKFIDFTGGGGGGAGTFLMEHMPKSTQRVSGYFVTKK